MAITNEMDRMAIQEAATTWFLLRLLGLKPPGRIRAMVKAARSPLAEAMATGDHSRDLIITPDVLQRVAARTRNKVAFVRGVMRSALWRIGKVDAMTKPPNKRGG
jgi:hypothetical protein